MMAGRLIRIGYPDGTVSEYKSKSRYPINNLMCSVLNSRVFVGLQEPEKNELCVEYAKKRYMIDIEDMYMDLRSNAAKRLEWFSWAKVFCPLKEHPNAWDRWWLLNCTHVETRNDPDIGECCHDCCRYVELNCPHEYLKKGDTPDKCKEFDKVQGVI